MPDEKASSERPGSAGVPPASGVHRRPSPHSKPLAAETAALPGARGWYSRGYLPHFDRPNLIQGITFRLADALPDSVIDKWNYELQCLDDSVREIELRKRIDKYLDAGHGDCILCHPQVAAIVENSLLHFDQQRYALIAWCVMPNHVHAMIEPWERWPLAGVIHAWKSFTAHEINKLLKRSGAVWQREYHDRFIRDADHFANARRYIEDNPVKATLVANASQWRWSSAFRSITNAAKPNAAGSAAVSAAVGSVHSQQLNSKPFAAETAALPGQASTHAQASSSAR